MDANNKPETIVYLDSRDLLKAFVIFLVIVVLLFVFLLGRSVGAENIREDLSRFCKTGVPFLIEGRPGLFSCYRIDVEDK